jgi:TonB family protein
VIPPNVEAQFANRNVYTLAFPPPNLPEYAGDWILWFAERQEEAGGAARISAPVPARKYAWVSPPAGAAEAMGEGIAMLAAQIDRNGKILSARLVRAPAAEAFRARALEEFQMWEFQPALHNGEPVAVDVVVEISFRFGRGTH